MSDSYHSQPPEASRKRKPLSKRVRFEIFKRDGFACQYCGATPPDALLHVDHIVAIFNGGGDEETNLITACDSCNLGKGARHLDDAMPAAPSFQGRAEEIAEREAQLAAYRQAWEEMRERIEEECWEIAEIFSSDAREGFRRDWFNSIERFLSRLGFGQVFDAAEYAVARLPYKSETSQFKYFCGTCWNLIKARDDG